MSAELQVDILMGLRTCLSKKPSEQIILDLPEACEEDIPIDYADDCIMFDDDPYLLEIEFGVPGTFPLRYLSPSIANEEDIFVDDSDPFLNTLSDLSDDSISEFSDSDAENPSDFTVNDITVSTSIDATSETAVSDNTVSASKDAVNATNTNVSATTMTDMVKNFGSRNYGRYNRNDTSTMSSNTYEDYIPKKQSAETSKERQLVLSDSSEGESKFSIGRSTISQRKTHQKGNLPSPTKLSEKGKPSWFVQATKQQKLEENLSGPTWFVEASARVDEEGSEEWVKNLKKSRNDSGIGKVPSAHAKASELSPLSSLSSAIFFPNSQTTSNDENASEDEDQVFDQLKVAMSTFSKMTVSPRSSKQSKRTSVMKSQRRSKIHSRNAKTALTIDVMTPRSPSSSPTLALSPRLSPTISPTLSPMMSPTISPRESTIKKTRKLYTKTLSCKSPSLDILPIHDKSKTIAATSNRRTNRAMSMAATPRKVSGHELYEQLSTSPNLRSLQRSSLHYIGESKRLSTTHKLNRVSANIPKRVSAMYSSSTTETRLSIGSSLLCTEMFNVELKRVDSAHLGVFLETVEGKVYVVDIAYKSVADKRNLYFGDQILEVNGLVITDHPWKNLYNIVQTAELVRLVVQRPYMKKFVIPKSKDVIEATTLGIYLEGNVIRAVRSGTRASDMNIPIDQAVIAVNQFNTIEFPSQGFKHLFGLKEELTIVVIPSTIYFKLLNFRPYRSNNIITNNIRDPRPVSQFRKTPLDFSKFENRKSKVQTA